MKPESIELVHQAIELSDAEDYAGALDLLTRAISADSSNAQAYFERGMVLLNLDQDRQAIADFDRALAISPDFPGALDWRSRALQTVGDHQAAADDRLKSLQMHPEGPHEGMGVSPKSWADCAEAFIKAGNHQKARELLEEYFNTYSHKVTSYACYETAPMRLLAKLLIQTGEITRACGLAQKAYSSEHRCPIDILTYALALEASGELFEARQICAVAMEINDQMPGLRELNKRLDNVS